MHVQYLKYILNNCIYGTSAQLKYKKSVSYVATFLKSP